MGRVLFATAGSLGDLFPYIAVSRVLLSKGHQVVIATSENYRRVIEGLGIEFYPVPPPMEDEGSLEVLACRSLDLKHGHQYFIKQRVMPFLGAAYEALSRAYLGADLLVSHPLAFPLRLVAEKTKIPWVSSVVSPFNLMSCDDPPLIANLPGLRKFRYLGAAGYRCAFSLVKLIVSGWEKPLRDYRKSLGLPQTRGLGLFEGQFSPRMNLALFDYPLAKPQPDWPQNTVVCNAPLYDGGGQAVPADLRKFIEAGEPPIIFTLGSVVSLVARGFWEVAIEATQSLGKRALLLSGSASLPKLPPNVLAYPYLPYSTVFPFGGVVVHQGGVGTLAHAMRSGCSQLMVPLTYDQPDNARRAKELGVGRVIPFGKVTAQNLTQELTALMQDATYQENALSLATTLKNTNGAVTASLALEGFL